MFITSTIKNSSQKNDVIVSTEGSKKELFIPAKADGKGSSINGAELLFLSLATCFCNDIYREATRRKIEVSSVEVTVSGSFGGEGEPASPISYNVKIDAPNNSDLEIKDLINHVDKIAEIHNTLRQGVSVTLST